MDRYDEGRRVICKPARGCLKLEKAVIDYIMWRI